MKELKSANFSYSYSSVLWNNKKYFKHIKVILNLGELVGKKIEGVLTLDGEYHFYPCFIKSEGNIYFLGDCSSSMGFTLTKTLKEKSILSWNSSENNKFPEGYWKQLEIFGVFTKEFINKYKKGRISYEKEQLLKSRKYWENEIEKIDEKLKKI